MDPRFQAVPGVRFEVREPFGMVSSFRRHGHGEFEGKNRDPRLIQSALECRRAIHDPAPRVRRRTDHPRRAFQRRFVALARSGVCCFVRKLRARWRTRPPLRMKGPAVLCTVCRRCGFRGVPPGDWSVVPPGVGCIPANSFCAAFRHEMSLVC